jgi:hypothetical protein
MVPFPDVVAAVSVKGELVGLTAWGLDTHVMVWDGSAVVVILNVTVVLPAL